MLITFYSNRAWIMRNEHRGRWREGRWRVVSGTESAGLNRRIVGDERALQKSPFHLSQPLRLHSLRSYVYDRPMRMYASTGSSTETSPEKSEEDWTRDFGLRVVARDCSYSAQNCAGGAPNDGSDDRTIFFWMLQSNLMNLRAWDRDLRLETPVLNNAAELGVSGVQELTFAPDSLPEYANTDGCTRGDGLHGLPVFRLSLCLVKSETLNRQNGDER
jgi:hypothetical protein